MKKEKLVFRICNDRAFKEIFTRCPTVLTKLVSDCLNIDYDYFKDKIKIETSSELLKGNVKNKTTFCDFVIQVGEYFKINIEINQSKYSGLSERNLLFLSRLYASFIPKGTSYNKIPKYKVVQFNINRFSNPSGNIISRKVIVDKRLKK